MSNINREKGYKYFSIENTNTVKLEKKCHASGKYSDNKDLNTILYQIKRSMKEIQVLHYWKYKYINLQKVGKLWKDASPQIQDRKLAGNAAIWDIHGIQKKKKHNNKNEVNAKRYLAAFWNSFVFQKEENIFWC